MKRSAELDVFFQIYFRSWFSQYKPRCQSQNQSKSLFDWLSEHINKKNFFRRDASSSDDSDSGPDDRAPVKKVKSGNAGSSDAAQGSKKPTAEDGPFALDIGRNRIVKINEFKGKRYIDIREHYVDKASSETKPGKKGITLYLDEFNKLIAGADDIKKALSNF